MQAGGSRTGCGVIGPADEHRGGVVISRFWTAVAIPPAAAGALFGAVGNGSAAAPLCAFHQSTTAVGRTATATFRVVQDGCEVSFVSIKKFADEAQNFIYNSDPPTAPGKIFAKSYMPYSADGAIALR